MGRKWITKNGYIVQQVLSCNNPLLISSKTNNILVDTGSKVKWMKLYEKINKILSVNGILSAIILCSSEKSTGALHYILIKYEYNTFKMLNSSAIYGNGIDNVIWENFIIESNGKLRLERDTPYLYTGAGILIK